MYSSPEQGEGDNPDSERLRYTYRPDSDLFVVYNLGSQFNSIAAGNPILARESRLTVKLTYSFLR